MTGVEVGEQAAEMIMMTTMAPVVLVVAIGRKVRGILYNGARHPSGSNPPSSSTIQDYC